MFLSTCKEVSDVFKYIKEVSDVFKHVLQVHGRHYIWYSSPRYWCTRSI
jgi:hypothetical protein